MAQKVGTFFKCQNQISLPNVEGAQWRDGLEQGAGGGVRCRWEGVQEQPILGGLVFQT
jgi:hypothetical protein